LISGRLTSGPGVGSLVDADSAQKRAHGLEKCSYCFAKGSEKYLSDRNLICSVDYHSLACNEDSNYRIGEDIFGYYKELYLKL
jgi:hypothetical protein